MRLLKTRRQWTVRDFFYWFLSCAGGNYSLNGVYLMMELKKGEKKRESRVYKVISRRIIKHHEMILECFLWWCLSSSSSLIFSVPPPSSVGIFIHGIKASRVSSCCIMTFVNLELWMVSSRSRWTTVLASSWDVALIASSSSANDNRAENYIWIKSKISVNEGLLSQDHVLLCGGSRIVQIFLLKYSPLLMLLKCRWASHNFFFPLSSSSSRRLIFMFIACAKKNPYRNRFMPLHDSPYERESEKNASICEKGKNENLSHKGIIMRALEAFSKIGIIKF